MDETVRKHLFDIAEAAGKIMEFTAGSTLATFSSNDLLQAAVERKFEIIGEALSRIKRIAPDQAAKIPEHERIIGFRNIIAHGYDIIDVGILWAAITDHLPPLKKKVDTLLR